MDNSTLPHQNQDTAKMYFVLAFRNADILRQDCTSRKGSMIIKVVLLKIHL